MNTLNAPRTNMEIADCINRQIPFNNAPYFNQGIHDFLIAKGAEFKQEKAYKLSYGFEIDGEQIRLLFSTDLDQGDVRVQYFWEEEDDELMPVAKWLTHYLFSIPVGENSLERFKQILNAYIDQL